MHRIFAFAALLGLAAAQDLDPTTPIRASFTKYGAGDTFGSGNCQSNTVACGFFTSGPFDYYAAISQNYYGCGGGGGACHGCQKCWLLNPETDSTGNPLRGARSIVVKINNLCPVEGNTLCAQQGTSCTNQLGAHLNIDTCIDSGASQALFGDSGQGLALGTAQQVDCSQWGKNTTDSTPAPGTPSGASTGTGAEPAPGSGSNAGGTGAGAGSGPGASTGTSTGAVPGSGSGTQPDSAMQTLYGQCGGQEWSGPTGCQSGSACKYQNPYYSQCLGQSKRKRRVAEN